MIVADASAAVAALTGAGAARTAMSETPVHSLHLVDSEIASSFRRLAASDRLTAEQATTALSVWSAVAVTRYAAHRLLDRIWELRHNLSAYDAGYVALAEALTCPLLTADARLSRAPGLRCPVTVVPG